MDRAGQELEAAGLLAGHGFAAPAVSRAYFAAFYAAEEALALVGMVRSKHSGGVAAVAPVLVRQQGRRQPRRDPRGGGDSSGDGCRHRCDGDQTLDGNQAGAPGIVICSTWL